MALGRASVVGQEVAPPPGDRLDRPLALAEPEPEVLAVVPEGRRRLQLDPADAEPGGTVALAEGLQDGQVLDLGG